MSPVLMEENQMVELVTVEIEAKVYYKLTNFWLRVHHQLVEFQDQPPKPPPKVETTYFSDNSQSLPGMSGNSQGPTGFLPGMFKEEVTGENKHAKEDAKSGKVLNKDLIVPEISMEILFVVSEQKEEKGQEETQA